MFYCIFFRVQNVSETGLSVAPKFLGIGYWVLGIGYWVLGIGTLGIALIASRFLFADRKTKAKDVMTHIHVFLNKTSR